jgi:nitrogen fixation NifU-like protein
MIRFSNRVIEHFQHQRNVGELEYPDGIGTVDNPVCGDVTEPYLRIKDGVIEDAKFKSFGCAVTIALASVFTGKIKGAEIYGLLSGSDSDVVKRLVGLIENELGELPAVKLHCPPATVQAFLGAVLRYYGNQQESKITYR